MPTAAPILIVGKTELALIHMPACTTGIVSANLLLNVAILIRFTLWRAFFSFYGYGGTRGLNAQYIVRYTMMLQTL